ncbi:hypothetical protein OQA88_9038 [Cercophora sp. LCS_1]
MAAAQKILASHREITLSLHNISSSTETTPLTIWIPPFSFLDGYDPKGLALPRWLQRFPTATINYRWPGFYLQPSKSPTEVPGAHNWPNPIHDISFGYQWILQNLAPPTPGRRDIYIYGSYLGASLAVSLGLTESHAHEPAAIRGLIAYNGIYDWTTFLPSHPINNPRSGSKTNKLFQTPPRDDQDPSSPFSLLKSHISNLFPTPSSLFDPFASPSLFFHTAPLHCPPDFDTPYQSTITNAIDSLSSIDSPDSAVTEPQEAKHPRKSYLTFPPRKSTLQIPETLLLFDPAPSGISKGKRRANSFQTQAEELAGVMRRSVEMVELKERMKWDCEFEDPAARREEAERRVVVGRVGGDGEGDGELGVLDLNKDGEGILGEWLEDRGVL